MNKQLCNRGSFTGGACELKTGHKGPHQITYEDGDVQSWTDEETTRMAQRYSSRFD